MSTKPKLTLFFFSGSGNTKYVAEKFSLQFLEKYCVDLVDIDEFDRLGKGFDDAVVFFGEEVVEVIVKSEALTQAEALTVADVVCSVTGIELRNVRVRFRK